MILARRGPRPLIYLPTSFPAVPRRARFHSVQSLSSQPVAGFPFRPAAGNNTLPQSQKQKHYQIPAIDHPKDQDATQGACANQADTDYPKWGKTPYRALQGHCRACQRSDTPPGTPHGIVHHILGIACYMIVYVNRIQLTFHYGTYSQKQGFCSSAASPDFLSNACLNYGRTLQATRDSISR